MKFRKIVLVLLVAVLFSLNIPTLSLAYGESVVGLNVVDLVDLNLPDTQLVLLKTPPAISAQDTRLGDEVYINAYNSSYADCVTTVLLNGQPISKGGSGFKVNTFSMGLSYIVIDKSNITSPGNYSITLQATDFFDAKCTVEISAKYPPV